MIETQQTFKISFYKRELNFSKKGMFYKKIDLLNTYVKSHVRSCNMFANMYRSSDRAKVLTRNQNSSMTHSI